MGGWAIIKNIPFTIIMKSKFNKQDIVIYKSNKFSDYGVIQDKKLVGTTGMILSSYFIYQVKFSMTNGVLLTKWVKEDEIKKHPELEFGNQLCNICVDGQKAKWVYGIPSCRPTCSFKEYDLDEDFGKDEDEDSDEASTIICSYCGKAYDCVAYRFCPHCYNDSENKINEDEDAHYSSDLSEERHRYLEVHYDSSDLTKYKKSQLLGLKVRRVIMDSFKKFNKPSIMETVVFRIHRQVYIKNCENVDVWGEIDRIILISTNELLRDRISIHSVKRGDGHIQYNGFNMLLTDNINETEYQIDGPRSRLSILERLEKEKYEKERKENQESLPYYIG